MLNINPSAPVNDNRIVINGILYAELSDTECQKVIDVINGLVNARGNVGVGTPQQAPTRELHLDETSDVVPVGNKIVGKPMWQEDFVTVTVVNDSEYRVYINCPVKGEKGKAMRYALKQSAKECGAKFAGTYPTDMYWTFPSKAEADKYVKARKAYAKKKAQ